MKLSPWLMLAVPWAAWYFGFALNAIAVAANHGAMPVLFPQVLLELGVSTLALAKHGDYIHSVMTPQTHLKVLCDWILVRGEGIFSIGDIFELFGELTQPIAPVMFLTLVLDKLGVFKDLFFKD
jgi:hypothetical protein